MTVEAGITLHDLGEELRSRGLAMENQGDVDPQTLAGAISTATHGTGAGFGNLSSQVVGVRLVDGTGEVRELRAGRRAPRRAREPRRARRDLRGHAPLRARVHDPPDRRAAAARRRALALRRAGGRARPLGGVRDAVHARGRSRSPRSAPTASPSRAGRAGAFMHDVVLENAVLGAVLPHRPGVPAADPVTEPHAGPADERLRAPRRQQPRVRERAAGPLHGDGVRAAARARRRGARAGAGADRAPPAAGRLPDRAPRDRAGRRAPLDRPRPARPPTSPSTSTRGWSSRPTSAPSRRSWTTTTAAPTGASATTRRPPRCAPATPSGTASTEIRDRLDPERRFENDYLRRVLTGSGAASGPA